LHELTYFTFCCLCGAQLGRTRLGQETVGKLPCSACVRVVRHDLGCFMGFSQKYAWSRGASTLHTLTRLPQTHVVGANRSWCGRVTQVLHLIHSGAELGEGMLMDSFRLQSIGHYCPSIRDINLCDTPFCENDVQVRLSSVCARACTQSDSQNNRKRVLTPLPCPRYQVLVKECKNLRELRVGMKSNPGTRYEITDSWVYQVINFSTKIEVLKVPVSPIAASFHTRDFASHAVTLNLPDLPCGHPHRHGVDAHARL
jgi:hypothetical protein